MCIRDRDGYAFLGLCVLAGTALFGIAVSFLMRPVFIYRYMLPAAGCFWFCFSYFLSRQKKALVLVPSLLVLLFVGAADYSAFVQGEVMKKEQMTRTEEELAKIGAEDIVLFNFDQVQAVTGWYLPRESYLYGGTPETLIREMFPGVYAVPGEEWIDPVSYTHLTLPTT